MTLAGAQLSTPRLPGVFIESDAPLAETNDWQVPLVLAKAMMAGTAVEFAEAISGQLKANLDMIQELLASWVEGARRVEVKAPVTRRTPARGVSLFFSGGVDSFYSLVKHRDEVENLILVHGFDIPLADEKTFALTLAQARGVADAFGKRLVVVRTNLHWEQAIPFAWTWYHGPSLAAISHALAPIHQKVYIASSHSYGELHPWGSNPLLDPLWSSEAVRVVHDGGERRVDKLRELGAHPEALSRLRVCWENLGDYNCGVCEKCVRTMVALKGLDVPYTPPFPDTLTPAAVRRLELSPAALIFWRELMTLPLPPDIRAAAESAMTSAEYRLPPRTGTLKREVKRMLYAGREILKVLSALRR